MKETFKIKNRYWTIETASDQSEKLLLDGSPCLAQVFLRTRSIYVNDLLLDDPTELYFTIAHELTHATLHAYVIDKKQFRDEEYICEFTAIYGAEIVELAKKLTELLLKNNK